MHPGLQQDLEQFPQILERTRQIAENFLAGVKQRPVCPLLERQQLQPGDEQLAQSGTGALAALDDFWRRYEAGISASAGPRYFGFVTGGATPAAVAADWLVSVIDQNSQLSHDTIAAAIELATIEQLKSLLGLPETHSGSFVSGATMANFAGLAIGRQWLGQQRGIDVAQQGLAALGEIQVLAANPHASSVKALSMLGIGRHALKTIASLPHSEAIDTQALERHLAASAGVPTLVLASAGTVNTVTFDDLPRLLALRERYPFWLHVDAAFGGVAACSPRYAPLLAGWQQADSITVDAHKWLNVPYDSAIQFTRHLALQMQVFQNHSAYMEAPTLRPDNYLHLTPENSRRFRALPLWLALKAYGRDGMRDIVERNVKLARLLGAELAASDDFRLLAPVNLNVVCFALNQTAGDAAAARDRFIARLDAHGVVRCTPTLYNGQPGIRAALVNWMTEEEDIRQTLASLHHCLPEQI
ncbi:pyridoxal phosphate-dependent decarboxylase family protein [Serratia entomophila]|uniref:pyridoxal phosphate-dependent decarboxylase family protein n=1 Tax=Serratia entomophila TaxID=42906 RepID=UPI00217755AB|nr:pyridoxal-dependent decarboxylase [Serratia entomophila]CAI0738760.1 L-2,4-diaminobutyrate decarboxylase [Serratia entomophila]CAI0839945.1 L-2,4-diaminobutyrate decarboxylase [Serratia entomophila]CAI1586095.1 L-2,4-diaminobutyrate decarboxylase [Serratia entomophila]CAI1655065.1 L-2,4-diaminobutyrate decarboxylase [Serratia entomophila]CAI1657111.1 L-2,4-diaminobutyrate decarboxylase [Serratia entomophila]